MYRVDPSWQVYGKDKLIVRNKNPIPSGCDRYESNEK